MLANKIQIGADNRSEVAITLKVNKPGVIYAAAFCNIHGHWRAEKSLKVV